MMRRATGQIEHDFQAIFEKLKAILKKYEKGCIVERDTKSEYYLNSRKLDPKGRPLFFAAASINKISVSYYLMAVHTSPGLLPAISPSLKKCLHGKCCFRFASADQTPFKELAALTRRAFNASDW